MQTHRFGRKLKLPATSAIKHQILKSMLEESIKADVKERSASGEGGRENPLADAGLRGGFDGNSNAARIAVVI
jgi:hypothetical protein